MEYRPKADELGLARIAKEREEAGRKLALNRDIVAWQATMTRLDAAEALARQPLDAPRLTPLEIVDYLRSLPALWADSGPDGRQMITSAIFARTEVLGFQRLEYELTEDAIELGPDAALPAVLELKAKVGGFGRGERACPDKPAATAKQLSPRHSTGQIVGGCVDRRTLQPSGHEHASMTSRSLTTTMAVPFADAPAGTDL